MCGFAGFHSPRDFPSDSETLVRSMAERLWQRGPDAAGEWISPELGIALGFRRLAVIDTSELGHQPMISANGRFVLAVNGEVYNHRILRAQLERLGACFHGNSDTEVLLAAISAWGLKESLDRTVGMFALALVDVAERRLLLGRDRLGEKPLYYGWSNGCFFFGSDLKAFHPHPAFSPEVDRAALTLYLRRGYVPSPHCILSGFQKLPPGHILSLKLDGKASTGKEQITCYWSLPRPTEAERPCFEDSPEDCLRKLEFLLQEAIRMQMVADVPVGVFLSGGIDSSTIVSLIQAQSAVPARTFTIGFPDAYCDESAYAERIALHLRTTHTTWQCADTELLELVNQIPAAYSEPFADDSQVPTMALARLARRHVTVCLSGDGGDELFLGYGRYRKALQRWQQIDRGAIRLGAELAIASVTSLVRLLGDCPWKRRWLSQLGRARKQWLPQHLESLYGYRMSVVKAPELYLNRFEPAPELFDAADAGNDLSCLSYLDLHTYLPDDLLVKVDRGAMAFSLETRMPFLDHRLVEYAARIPDAVKWREGLSKWPLRQILKQKVPFDLSHRWKMGFNPPTRRWLRGPLREWAEEQFGESRLRREGFFDVREVRREWNEHLRGRRHRTGMLWAFLMFQAWYESFCSKQAPIPDGRMYVAASNCPV